MADIIITHGVIIAIDPERRIIEDGAVAIQTDRITVLRWDLTEVK
jgi:cytosine/adenosine deaminase-related metal-dependent hydrolase